MVKARPYSIWSYVPLPIPTITTWRLYGKSISDKIIKEKSSHWFNLTSICCIRIKRNISYPLLSDL